MKKLLCIAAFTVLFLFAVSAANGQGIPIYDNIPNPLAGNYQSLGYEATSTYQFGDRIQFSSGTWTLKTVSQTMSSWGCETGRWSDGSTCQTTPGATFSHPLTLKIYSVSTDFAPMSLLAEKTQTFQIPFRPSADSVHCTNGRWYDASAAKCYSGLAFTVMFDLSNLNITLPSEVVYSVSYNTSHYGATPIGEATTCFSSSGGCGYDSLNVALVDPATYNSVGDNPAPSDAYLYSTWGGAYCDSTLGTGTFRLDAGCWLGYKPAVRFNGARIATSPDDCKNGGWRSRTTLAGQPFPNQGQCLQYFNNGN